MRDSIFEDNHWEPDSSKQLALVGSALWQTWEFALRETRAADVKSRQEEIGQLLNKGWLASLKGTAVKAQEKEDRLRLSYSENAEYKNKAEWRCLVRDTLEKKLEFKLYQTGLRSTGDFNQDWVNIGKYEADNNSFKVVKLGRKPRVKHTVTVDEVRALVFTMLKKHCDSLSEHCSDVTAGLGRLDVPFLIRIFQYMVQNQDQNQKNYDQKIVNIVEEHVKTILANGDRKAHQSIINSISKG